MLRRSPFVYQLMHHSEHPEYIVDARSHHTHTGHQGESVHRTKHAELCQSKQGKRWQFRNSAIWEISALNTGRTYAKEGMIHKSKNVDMPGAIVTLSSTALLHLIVLGGMMVTHCNALAYVVKDNPNQIAFSEMYL